MLTNDRSFWIQTTKQNVTDPEFRIHESTMIFGERSWSQKAGQGTIVGRETPIVLRGKYIMKWNNFFCFPLRNGDFRYIINEVNGDNADKDS